MAHADAYRGSHLSLISIHAAGVRGVQFLDCRLARDHAAAHIPGALYLNVRGLRRGPLAELPTSIELASHFVELGIDGEQTIVPYADRYTFSLAGYAWWVLRYAGFRDVCVLHGGFEAWKSAGFPVEAGEVERPEPLGTSAVPPLSRLPRRRWPWPFGPMGRVEMTELPMGGERTRVDAAWIQERQNDDRVRLIDARTRSEFEAGHIHHRAGTYNISHDAVFDTSEGTLIHPGRLRELFMPIERGKRVVAYGRTGVRSGTILWALAAAGYDSLRHYDGSILDWEHRRLPLEKSI